MNLTLTKMMIEQTERTGRPVAKLAPPERYVVCTPGGAWYLLPRHGWLRGTHTGLELTRTEAELILRGRT